MRLDQSLSHVRLVYANKQEMSSEGSGLKLSDACVLGTRVTFQLLSQDLLQASPADEISEVMGLASIDDRVWPGCMQVL